MKSYLLSSKNILPQWFFIIGLFFMLAGDFPRFPFGIKERILPLLVLSWPKFYLMLLCFSFLLYIWFNGATFQQLKTFQFLKVPLMLLTGSFFLSALLSQAKWLGIQAFFYYLTLVFILIMFCSFIQHKEIRALLYWTLLFAMLSLSLKVILWRLEEGLWGAAYHIENNSWLGKLQIAWVFNLFAPLFLTKFLVEEQPIKWILSGFLWLASGFSILLLFSRSGTLTFFLITLLICAFNLKSWKKLLWLLMLFLLIVCPFIKKSSSMTSYVLHSTSKFYEDPGFKRRLGIWKETIQMFVDHPLLGIGFGTYDDIAYSVYHTPHDVVLGRVNWFYRNGWHAHNLFLHLLAETGILGMLAFGYLWWTIVRYLLVCYRQVHSARIRSYILALFCSLGALLVLGMSENLMALRVHESFRMNLTFWFLVIYLLQSISMQDDAEKVDGNS